MAVQMDLAFSEHMMGIHMKVLSVSGITLGYGELTYVKELLPSERLTPERILNVKGNWKASLPHGLTEVSYGNGDIFRGLYLDGSVNGYGERIFADGSVFKGTFEGSEDNITSGHI